MKKPVVVESNQRAAEEIRGFAANQTRLARSVFDAFHAATQKSLSLTVADIVSLVKPKPDPSNNLLFVSNESDVSAFVQQKLHDRIPEKISLAGVTVSKKAISPELIDVPNDVSELELAVVDFREYSSYMLNMHRRNYSNVMSMVVDQTLFNIENGAVVLDEGKVDQLVLSLTQKVTNSDAQVEVFQIAKAAADALNTLMAMNPEIKRQLEGSPVHFGHFMQVNEVVKWNYDAGRYEPGAKFIERFF